MFSDFSLYGVLGFILVVGVLVGLNEIARRSFIASIIFYVVFPILTPLLFLLGVFQLADSTSYWFPWVKHYSAVAGILGFLFIRYRQNVIDKKFAVIFPALILCINILEAVYNDFSSFGSTVFDNGLWIIGGPWNILNGLSGLLCMAALTGYTTIYISKSKSKDMILPDMTIFWIVGYTLWNFAYVYNCIGDRSFYAGFALLVAPLISELFIKKGAWLQHRANTLGLYTLFVLIVPAFAESSVFAVKSSNSEGWLLTFSLISFLFNLGLLVFTIYTAKKRGVNPYMEACFDHLELSKKINEENK